MKNVGKNCNAYDQPKATGMCYKTTFGDWRCTMIDINSYAPKPYQAPPRSEN